MSKGFGATSLIGGGTGALDAIPVADLSDGNACTVYTSLGAYHYHYNATSGATENSPYVIKPDDVGGGDQRWILLTPHGAFSHVRVDRAATLSIPDAVWTTFPYNGTKDHDTLSEYNITTGIFTAIYAGKYLVNAIYSWESISFTIGQEIAIGIAKNADVITYVGERDVFQASYSAIITRMMSTVVDLAVADTIKIVVFQNSIGALNAGGSTNRNYLTIDRVA